MLSVISRILFNEFFLYSSLALLTCFYVFAKYSFSYWKRRNIYSPPTNSWLGHYGDGLKMSIGQMFAQLYQNNKHQPIVGVYFSFFKQLMVNDLDLVKNVLQKDYAYFEGHGFKANKEHNPLFQHLFNLEGEEWKKIRVKLTPTFTSSKMKYMFDTVYACNEVMVEYLKDRIKHNNDVEIKEVIAKLGTDVISSCAFGIECNSFKDPNSEFRKNGKKIFVNSSWMSLYDIISLVAPWITLRLPLSRLSNDVVQFFTNAVKETIDYREKNNVVRNDFLQLLIEMKNSDKKSEYRITMEEIIPEVFVFFVAGFETSATTVQYALLELAKNPKVRDNLVKTLDDAVETNGGKITYELVYNLTCLNEVVDETLRMYPPVPLLTRTCTKTYKVPNTDMVIEKNTPIIIPVLGIHRNPEIYPDPDKFIPDRFSAENVKSRHQYAHIPFGEGPRICIGSRFGSMQSKLALLVILRNFHLELSPKTILPLKYDKNAFLLHTEGDMILRLSSRIQSKQN